MRSKDPLGNPADLIPRVYSYVAYRIGDGPDAEDVTSDVFERALRYRASYDEHRGRPVTWLLGIARRCVDDALKRRTSLPAFDVEERPSTEDLEAEAVHRVAVAGAINRLDARARDLLALRYGADLSAREIGEVIGARTNAVEVALHRALTRVRTELEESRPGEGSRARQPAPREPAPRIAP
jgi:RNA polymerase sigma-70 factor (ECF subfamily)